MSSHLTTSRAASKPRRHKSHRSRLARWAQTEMATTYHQARAMVDAAADSGRLPNPLDDAGMNVALRIVLQQDLEFDRAGRPVSACPRIYPSLTTLLLAPIDPRAAAASRRAHAIPPVPLERHGTPDPVALLADRPDVNEDDVAAGRYPPEDAAPWMQAVLDAGPRADYEILSVPADPDRRRAVDAARDYLRATGDVESYLARVRHVVEANPADVDTHSYLGWTALHQHEGQCLGFYALDLPDTAQRRRLLDEALVWFQTAVLIGERTLGMGFTGALSARWVGNRPFFRALHGLGVTLWRQQRFLSAERVAVTMLWLDPADRFDSATLLDLARQRIPWKPGFPSDELRTEAVVLASQPVRVVPGSLRGLLASRSVGSPSPATVAEVVRRAAAVALGGERSGHYILVPEGEYSRDTVAVRVFARHQRGHDLEPDAYWWDAHHADEATDELSLFVLVGDYGRILLARLLRPEELRRYRAAALPRRDRTAFTTTFVHHGTSYGVELTDELDRALDQPANDAAAMAAAPTTEQLPGGLAMSDVEQIENPDARLHELVREQLRAAGVADAERQAADFVERVQTGRAKPTPDNDAYLWGASVSALNKALPDQQPLIVARQLIAILRRVREPHRRTWAPGDELPSPPPAKMFDLDGDLWMHQRAGNGCYRMSSKDRRRNASSIHNYEGVQVWPFLLEAEGPFTEGTPTR
jgi:hypothetical protein